MTRSLIWLTSVRHTTCSVNYVILEPKCIILDKIGPFWLFLASFFHCKRNELDCSSACGECKGLCQNSKSDADTDDSNEYELV